MTQTAFQFDIEKVIADELAFAEQLSKLDEWAPGGELIKRYNDVDIACQCAMDAASKEDRERIRLAMVRLRDEQIALNQRATLTWAIRECEERRLQSVDLVARITSSVEVKS